jgi:putative ABC transport system permease protein
MYARLVAYLRGIARRRTISAEVDEELRFHVEQETEAQIGRGLTPAEARRLALRDLGGMTSTTQAVRDVRTVWVDLLWRDTLHAVRSLRATPAFTSVALAVLMLSIGATTAIFSVVDAVVLRGLPFDESDRLVAVGELNIKESLASSLNRVAPQNFLDWRDRQDVFTGLAAVGYAEISLKAQGSALPENLRAQRVTADFFSVLRTAPLLGRAFTIDNEVQGRAQVAVISYGLWQRRFGGTPDVLGARLPGQTVSFEIVGVMPPGFAYPVDTYILGVREPPDVWVPYVFNPEDRIRGNSFGYNLHVVGRLRDDVSIERAQARMDQITATLAAETPRWFTDRVAKVEPLRQFVTRGVRTWMVMLLGAVSFVLLIACVNLANLMLVRATTRSRELGIRAALGASRWDLSRLLLLESLVLSLAGATLGVVVAWWGVEILRSAIPEEVPRAAGIAVDLRVLAVTALTAVATGVAFGLAPVVQFGRPIVPSALHQGERAATAGTAVQWLRGTLVVVEVALAVVLLVGSGLFLASFARVTAVNLGLDYRDVLAVQVRVLEMPSDVQKAAERNRQLLLNVLDRVHAMPGVEVAAILGGGLPLRGDLRTVDFAIPGRDLPRSTDIDFNQISADYFKAIKVPLLKGRGFTAADSQNSEPVVILNQTAAAKYFEGADAVGKVVRLFGNRTVVGVVGNVRHDGPESEWRTQAFVPLAQSRVLGATLVVRTSRGSHDVLPGIRRAISSEFAEAGIPTRVDEGALEQFYEKLVAQRRFNMMLLALFGLLGLVIAGVGIYGVMAYIVSQRTQEIGIRMALGALPSTILRSILTSAVVYMMIGLTLGLFGAWGLAGFVRGFLFEIQPHEPRVYAAVFAVLAMSGITAAFLPARRAARVDPLIALRME